MAEFIVPYCRSERQRFLKTEDRNTEKKRTKLDRQRYIEQEGQRAMRKMAKRLHKRKPEGEREMTRSLVG